jgi:hypothetical protein
VVVRVRVRVRVVRSGHDFSTGLEVLLLLDIDSHIEPLYGEHKQGADFSHKGTWSYHPLLVSMAATGECLAIRNRPGNAESSDGAAELVGDVLDRVVEHFDRVLVRGDSAFDRQGLREPIEHHDGYGHGRRKSPRDQRMVFVA